MSTADDLLADENFPSINQSFYAGNPAAYLRARLNLAMLMAAKPKDLDDLLRDGLEFRSVKVHPVGDGGDEEGEEQRAKDRHAAVTIESEVLVHHAVESLLRLYLAHRSEPACPALELARVRSPRDFKKLVKRRFAIADPAEYRDELARMFMVTDDRSRFGEDPPPEAEWERSLDVREGWLRYLAHLWLDRSPAYNVAKHGLGLTAGPGGFSIDLGTADRPLKIEREDDGLTYLTIAGTADGPRWFQSMLFVEPDVNFAYAYQAALMVDELWQVARARYVGASLKRIGLPSVGVDDVLKAHMEGKSPYQPQGYNMQLSYYSAGDSFPGA